MPATTEINTPTRSKEFTRLPVAASSKILAGMMVAVNSAGYAVKASDTSGLKVIGRAEETVDNSAGSAGGASITVRRGVFRWNNSAGSAIGHGDVGEAAFAEDDSTVAILTTNSIKAGLILSIDTEGVWIDTKLAPAI